MIGSDRNVAPGCTSGPLVWRIPFKDALLEKTENSPMRKVSIWEK
jgi:hypothetical protein